MIYLRQATADQFVPLGYFVDTTDGDTAETELTIANADVKLWKAGAYELVGKNADGVFHVTDGIYFAILDDVDTDTPGPLVLFCHVAGALAVRLECVVLAANVYDSLIGATDGLQVDAESVWDAPLAEHVADGSTGQALGAVSVGSDPMTATVPGAYVSGTLGNFLGHLSTAHITVVSAVDTAGAITLVRGDDYLASDGRALLFSSDAWPTLTDATIMLRVAVPHAGEPTQIVEIAATVVDAQTIQVEITRGQTLLIGQGTRKYDIEATLSGGDVATLVTGEMKIEPDVR